MADTAPKRRVVGWAFLEQKSKAEIIGLRQGSVERELTQLAARGFPDNPPKILDSASLAVA